MLSERTLRRLGNHREERRALRHTPVLLKHCGITVLGHNLETARTNYRGTHCVYTQQGYAPEIKWDIRRHSGDTMHFRDTVRTHRYMNTHCRDMLIHS